MQLEKNRPRVRLYERGEPEEGFAITPRDVSILRDLEESRFMTTQQFQAVYGARITCRLKVLFRHGFIERPKAGRFWRFREGGGSNALLLALSFQGAKVLAAAGYPRALARNWTELNRTLSKFSPAIPHMLDSAEVKVAFRKAVSDVPGLRLMQGDELDGQRSLEVPGRARRIVPDWIFMLANNEANEREPSLFFIERDRGTEPNERYGSNELQHLAFKYEGYLAYATARRHLQQFGVGNFRVLTIVSGGETKVANVAQKAGEVTGGNGPDRFLVTSSDALSRCGPFGCEWTNAAGESALLIP